MNDNQKLMIYGLLMGAVYLLWQSGDLSDRPRPTPPPNVPDMTMAFEGGGSAEEARKHAAELGDLCASIAAGLEYDGSMRSPRLTTDGHVQEFRTWARDYKTQGGSYTAKYPRLGETLKGYFKTRVGEDNKNLTDDKRREWITAYRDLSAALHYAAEEL